LQHVSRHAWFRGGSRPRGSRGQALVEFALVAPIFFLLVFSVIQLGLLFGAQNGIVDAVRETARYASTYRVASASDATAVCTMANSPSAYLRTVLARSVPGWDPSAVPIPQYAISYEWLQNPDGPGGTPGSYYVQINVKVTYWYPLYVPIVGNIIDGSDGTIDQRLKLSASESMRIENTALPAGTGTVTC
jgi:hypothetical protein